MTALLPWERLGSKVGDRHLARLAVVYVRQSTRQQVIDHGESTRLQYGLVDRAVALGWQASRVLVIDEDLGKSGAGAAGPLRCRLVPAAGAVRAVGGAAGRCRRRLRPGGVQRPVAAGVEGDDERGRAAPAQAADAGRQAGQGPAGGAGDPTADRLCAPPLGGGGAGPRRAGPDRRAADLREVRRARHAARGAALAGRPRRLAGDAAAGWAGQGRAGVAAAQPDDAAEHPAQPRLCGDLRLRPPPGRPPPAGARPAQHRPGRARPRPVAGDDPRGAARLHHRRDLPRQPGPAGRQRRPRRSARCGPRRVGAAWGAGTLRALRPADDGALPRPWPGHSPRVCLRPAVDRLWRGRALPGLAGACVDALVTQQVLAALAPAAVEVSLRAAEQVQAERAELERIWQQRLERAAISADRARRCYRLAEPEHRLVVRQLEADWETGLAAQQHLREDYDRFTRTRPRPLTSAQQQAITALAGDIPGLWTAPTTTDADRKQLIRALVDQVTITVLGRSERVAVAIGWAGGHTTHAETARPVARLTQLSSYPQLCDRVRQLAEQGHRATAIAKRLHAEGFRPAKGHQRIGVNAIKQLLRDLDCPPADTRTPITPPPGWYTRRRWTDPEPPDHNGAEDHAASSHI